jgi:predicted DNA-binding protein
MPAKTQPVSFRLSDDLHRRLTGLSAASGSSAGEYARELVLQKLDGEETDSRELDSLLLEIQQMRSEIQQMRRDFQQIQQIRADMSEFRADFELAVEALLVSSSSGKPVTPEHAKRWVAERLKGRKSTSNRVS